MTVYVHVHLDTLAILTHCVLEHLYCLNVQMTETVLLVKYATTNVVFLDVDRMQTVPMMRLVFMDVVSGSVILVEPVDKMLTAHQWDISLIAAVLPI